MAHVPPFTPDPRLYPFESKWFDHPHGRVHYIDEGEGDPIVFVHGNPTWSFLYRGIVIRLRKHFRCIAVDHLGFGLSERPENFGYTPSEHSGVLRDLVHELDLQRMTIMGHDWGGPIGLAVAVEEIGRLRALVMGNTWYWPVDSWQHKAFAYVMSMAPLQSKVLNDNLFVEQLLPKGVKIPMADEVLNHYRDAMPTPMSRIGAAELPIQIFDSIEWMSSLEHEVQESLAHVPMLLTWGINDPLFNRRAMERFRQDFKAARLTRLDASHFIQEDQPGEIADAIADFLGSPAA